MSSRTDQGFVIRRAIIGRYEVAPRIVPDTFRALEDSYERDEQTAQRDMRERGRRLRAYKKAIAGRVWWTAPSGEQYLVSPEFLARAQRRWPTQRAT